MFVSYTVAPERSRNLHASARGAVRPQTNRQEGLLIFISLISLILF